METYLTAGISHFEIKFIYPTIDRHLQMMELFSREVIANFG